jgi:sugar transferase (PEP-CTERM/EpsH1 system associated)
MARFGLEAPLESRPLVVDLVDVDSEKWALLAQARGMPLRWVYGREARTLRAFEATLAARAVTTLVINDRERDSLLTIAPHARVTVLSNGIDLEGFAPADPPTRAPTVIFCGVMNYYPNEQGVMWFAANVWPRVRAKRPDARFLVVGAHPTRAVQQLAAHDSSIEVTGSVPSVQPYLHRSAVSVAPLFLARGLQNKALEALAAGLPVVATPAVIEGLPPRVRPACERAESPDDFATAVVRLLAITPDERRLVAARAPLSEMTWAHCLRPLEGLLRHAAAQRNPGDTAIRATERTRLIL